LSPETYCALLAAANRYVITAAHCRPHFCPA
jgi:secreted trypsin-like serine protease